jgi:hypothetical protein
MLALFLHYAKASLCRCIYFLGSGFVFCLARVFVWCCNLITACSLPLLGMIGANINIIFVKGRNDLRQKDSKAMCRNNNGQDLSQICTLLVTFSYSEFRTRCVLSRREKVA